MADVADTMDLVVASVADVALDIRSFELRAPDCALLPPFAPGDHIDVHTPSGQVRQYSLYNAPTERDRYCIAVKREPNSRGGSVSMHQHLSKGHTLKVSRPRSNFPLEPANAYLLIAGGIGITPILSMMQRLEAQGWPTRLHYFIRGPEHGAFLRELARPRKHVQVSVHQGFDAAQVESLFQAEAQATTGAGTHAYICGPGPFMKKAKEVFQPKLGESAVHLEFFEPDAQPVTEGDKAFVVRLAKTCRDVQVGASETILEALAREGLKVPTSCQRGVCGTCVTKVVAGIPDHRDTFLSDFHRKANKKVAICVSRAQTEVLEIDM